MVGIIFDQSLISQVSQVTAVGVERAVLTIAESPAVESILNPFSVYRKGEALLRRQLSAFSVWHLVNIIVDYRLSDLPGPSLNAMSGPDLIELIVAAVRSEAAIEK